MISTRLHGAIDYAVATMLGSMAASRTLSPPMRGVLGIAGACHASYAALTDYEAGLSPRLTMRQHLALDALGAVALCGAALAMRRQSAGSRALLGALGLSELAVVALSSAAPVSGPGQHAGAVQRLLGGTVPSSRRMASYPPLDTPKPAAEDVFVVDSVLPGLLGTLLPARMTVIRLAGGDLLLHSPTRFSLALKHELETLGRIRHLVAPNVAHWTFLEDWQRSCPDAVTWAAPGLRERGQVRRSGLRLDRDLPDTAPAEWSDDVELVLVQGGLGFRETAMFHRPTRTLVLTDLVVNLEPAKVPAVLRPLARLFGMLVPDGMPPPYLRAVVKLRRQDAARAASRLLGLRPDRVIFAHGRWYQRDGTVALRRSLRWLLD